MPIRSKAILKLPSALQTPQVDKVTILMPYLLFDGSCSKAMQFYKSIFGGELTLTRVKDSPARNHMPASMQDKVLNAWLRRGNLELSASDWLRPDQAPVRGNTVCLFLSGGTFDQLNGLFKGLSEDAAITDPLTKQFFGVYGALNDKFGVRWMFQTNSQNG